MNINDFAKEFADELYQEFVSGCPSYLKTTKQREEWLSLKQDSLFNYYGGALWDTVFENFRPEIFQEEYLKILELFNEGNLEADNAIHEFENLVQKHLRELI